MRFFVRCLSLALAAVLLLALPTAHAEKDIFYIRVIAHDDTAYCQHQKILARDKLLSLLQAGYSEPAQLESALKAEGFPATISLRIWTPQGPYAAQPTLYVTLGDGQGHNWWGILCADAQKWDFLQAHKKSDASSDVASNNMQLVFPLLERLFSFLIFNQD